MKSLLPLMLFLIPVSTLLGQAISGDSILSAERSIDRPVTVHARQFRVTAGYDLGILSRRYDTEGELVKLRNKGLSSIRHRLTFDLKYGINDFVQLSAAIAHSGNAVREQTRYIYPLEPEPVVRHDVMREYSGLEDLFVGFDLRAPFKTRKLDIALSLGANLPVASFNPKQPQHSFAVSEEGGTSIHTFTYRHYYPMGSGTIVGQLGGIAKYRSKDWAVSAGLYYRHGLKEVESYEWIHQLNHNNEFEYRQNEFSYRLPDSFTYFAEVEYQARPWCDLFLNVSGFNAARGWASSQEELKIVVPFQSVLMVNPGLEILITSRLWFRQRVTFTLTGENHEAPFGFQTTLLYNFFPF